MGKFFIRILLLSSGLSGVLAHAQDELGRLGVRSLLLEPFFEIRDGQETEFNLRHSYLSGEWVYDQKIRAVLAFGQAHSIGLPSKYGPDFSDDELALVEGYAEFNGAYGRLRAGRQPVEFGLESGGREAELELPLSLLYRARVIGRRDMGLSYRIDHNRFYTALLVHNGEGAKETDNRVWLTGRWGWKADQGSALWDLGLAATTGHTTPVSTSVPEQESIDTVFDIGENAKWRLMNLYFSHFGRRWGGAFDVFAGKVSQDVAGENHFYGGHIDVFYRLNRHASVALRYDALEPDEKRDGDEVQQLVAAVSLHNQYQTSRLFLEGYLNLNSDTTFPTKVLLVWRLTSLSNSVFSF